MMGSTGSGMGAGQIVAVDDVGLLASVAGTTANVAEVVAEGAAISALTEAAATRGLPGTDVGTAIRAKIATWPATAARVLADHAAGAALLHAATTATTTTFNVEDQAAGVRIDAIGASDPGISNV